MKPELGVAILVVALVGACSTASYQKQIGAMAEGMSDARRAFELASEDERKAFVAIQVRRGLRPGNLLKMGPKCHTASSEPIVGPKSDIDCLPIVMDRRLGDRPVIFKPAAPNGLEHMRLVDEYGKTLTELAAAQDVAAVKEAEKRATAAIGAMASAFATPPAAAAVKAGLAVFDWAVGLYLDQQRLQELRRTVQAADPVISSGAEIIAREAKLFQSSIVEARANNLAHKEAALDDMARGDKRQAAGEEFVTEAIALNDYAKMDVTKPFKELAAAHSALKEALENPKLDAQAVFAEVSKFANSASNLREALAKLGGKK